MSADDDEEFYIKEITRFVEKKFSSSSSSETSDTCSDKSSKNHSEQPLSSDSDDYFKQIERKKIQNYRRIRKPLPSSSSDEEDSHSRNSSDCKASIGSNKNIVTTPKQAEFSSASEQEVLKNKNKKLGCSGPSFVRALKPKTKTVKRRKTGSRDERLRVALNIRRAIESSTNRTAKARSEWRQSRTFGLSVDSRGRTTSKDDIISFNQDKLEVQSLINQAVGEPSKPLASTSKTEDLPQRRPSCNKTFRNIPYSLQSSNSNKDESQKFRRLSANTQSTQSAVDKLVSSTVSRNLTEVRMQDRLQDRPDRVNRAMLGEKEEPELAALEKCTTLQDPGGTRGSSYSPPPNRWSSSSSDTRSSISLSGSHPVSDGFKDTSTIKKSPWFKGTVESRTEELWFCGDLPTPLGNLCWQQWRGTYRKQQGVPARYEMHCIAANTNFHE